MYTIDKNLNRIAEVKKKTFSELGFNERSHVQEWIANNPTFFGEELLFIQKEFDGFDQTRERLDLLALDKNGNIVVIENKLDDSGRDVTWQALKYASYCATLTKNQLRDIFQDYLIKENIDRRAEELLVEFFDAKEEFSDLELNKSQRIILVSGSFRKEVTSTALWLLNNYKLRIQCFKITPYSLYDQFLLNVEQVIPVKEAEEYIIKMADKAQEDSDVHESLKSRHKIRLNFWRKLLDRINSTSFERFRNINPSKDNWLNAGIGWSGVSLTFVISRKSARTEFYISRPSSEENIWIFNYLKDRKEIIEKKFGSALEWEDLEGQKSCRIKNELLDVSLYNEDDWEKMIEFMVDSMIRMERVFESYITEMKNALNQEGREL
ncbi:MAG: DUF4268 domain-containing protein [Gillisia sp.]